jgi:hypothetical protein
MERDVMRISRVSSALKTAIAVTSIVTGACGFISGVVYLIDRDHALCTPDKLDHSFFNNHHTRGVCAKADGTLYLSEKIRQ